MQEWIASARFVAFFAGVTTALSWRKVIKDPETAIFKYLLAVIQGACVISGSIGSAWYLSCCWAGKNLPRTFLPRARYFFTGALSSLFIFAVPASRRTELGLYVGRLSLASTWQVLEKRRKVKSVPNGDLILLALGLAGLCVMYEGRHDSLDKDLRTGLGYLIGKPQSGTSAEKQKQVQESMASDAQTDQGKGRIRKARFEI